MSPGSQRPAKRLGIRIAARYRRGLNLVLIVDFNLDRLLNAGRIQPQPRFITVRLDDQRERVAQVVPNLGERSSLTDGTRNFFDPPHEPAVGFRLDDGVISLFHTVHIA